ncbi:MAG TPA: VOC family protein [Candidatus Limnocylindrales bacterium]|nr:VOC family protein [Candidatus Limnocylindrales bacterium]
MAHGEINHIEFPADDPERAMAFYSAVAGWEFSAMDGFDEYWVFRSGEGYGGAVGKRGVSTGPVLRDYIEVNSIDDALAAGERTGGTVKEAKSEIAGMGWFAVLIDPEGTEIGLFQSSALG